MERLDAALLAEAFPVLVMLFIITIYALFFPVWAVLESKWCKARLKRRACRKTDYRSDESVIACLKKRTEFLGWAHRATSPLQFVNLIMFVLAVWSMSIRQSSPTYTAMAHILVPGQFLFVAMKSMRLYARLRFDAELQRAFNRAAKTVKGKAGALNYAIGHASLIDEMYP